MPIGDGLLDLAAVWQRPDGPAGDGWEVPREQVDDLLAHLLARDDVVAFYADVSGWESYIDVWSVRYRNRLRVLAALGGRRSAGICVPGSPSSPAAGPRR